VKDGEWLAWGPMHHWTDRKIRIHAFYCMLGISLLQYVQFVLFYPQQGDKGPDRTAYVLSKQTLLQQALAKELKLDKLQITQRG
jgi:hypothetical protein